MTDLARLHELLEKASARPWFVIGPPWNDHGAPWINAGSEDPHGGTFVCDLDAPDDNHRVEEWERVEADAQLIALAVNALPGLLEQHAQMRAVADTALKLAQHDRECRDFMCLMRDGCDDRVAIFREHETALWAWEDTLAALVVHPDQKGTAE